MIKYNLGRVPAEPKIFSTSYTLRNPDDVPTITSRTLPMVDPHYETLLFAYTHLANSSSSPFRSGETSVHQRKQNFLEALEESGGFRVERERRVVLGAKNYWHAPAHGGPAPQLPPQEVPH